MSSRILKWFTARFSIYTAGVPAKWQQMHGLLSYLPVKIILASGNFKHALHTVGRNLHAELQRDQNEMLLLQKKKIPTFTVADWKYLGIE